MAERADKLELSSVAKLTVYGNSQWNDPEVVAATRAEGATQFGPPSVSGEFHNWDLSVKRLAEALEFAFADDLRPKQALGPVSLYLSYTFDWRDMPNPPAVPSARLLSANSLGVHLGGRRAFVQPMFRFAASAHDPAFIARLRTLEAAMPFAPNDRCYYRVEAKKTGKGRKLVKLQTGWKDAG